MRIIYFFMMLLTITITAVSCVSDNTSGEMTKEDEARLVKLARIFILNNRRAIVTPQERVFIQTTYPVVDAVYDGYKTGLTSISWNTGKRRIVARLYGAMTGENHAWRLSVYFKPQVIITPRAKARMTPIKEGTVQDFSEIFRQQAVKSAPRKPKGKNKNRRVEIKINK